MKLDLKSGTFVRFNYSKKFPTGKTSAGRPVRRRIAKGEVGEIVGPVGDTFTVRLGDGTRVRLNNRNVYLKDANAVSKISPLEALAEQAE